MDVSPIIFRVHALQRMFERGVTQEDVRHVLATGETIERYPDDQPYPSRLILGWAGNRPLHVLVADNEAEGTIIVTTVYEPGPDLWEEDFRKGRRR
ncbi:MAG TPA: DUF4258 domain-containing protein [Candidatus Acetothermia bacterium]|nr:DUF4258 domain-containing protein [Candidatus Acetothermia bacterium]